jgi:methyl-accepting chemotaxis protein
MNFSMQTKLIALILGVAATLILGSIFSINKMTGFSENMLMKKYEQSAKSLATAISAQFFERYGDVQTFSKSHEVKNTDAAKLPDLLQDYTNLYGIYDVILVVDKNGKYVASNKKTAGGTPIDLDALKAYNYASEPWFRAVTEGRTTNDKNKGFADTFVEDFITDPVMTRALNNEKFGSSFSTKVTNDAGEFVGVITNRVNPIWFENEAMRLYQMLKAEGLESTEITVLNKDGSIVLDYDPFTHDNKAEPIHDPKVILKLNLVKNGVESAVFANSGKVGTMFSMHARKKIVQATGYSFIEDPKFISSIGWSVLVRENKDSALSAAYKIVNNTYLVLGVIAAIAILFAFWYSIQLAKSIIKVTDQVAAASTQVSTASEQLSKTAESLSSASQEQASSIEETSASLTEISGMVESNVRSAEGANEVAKEVAHMSEGTQRSMEELAAAMTSILDSNTKIEALVKVIEEIGEKTEVIDEIVFKTQLLSFNASVEAERAGEHGRGFSVVAQEVGNLAQMSGRAATEIAAIVKNSIKESVVVAQENKQRVQKGEEIVTDSRQQIMQVLTKINAILDGTNKIVIASKEQAQGIGQINSSVNNLNQVTQTTASNAQESASASHELSSQSESLLNLVDEMKLIVTGKKDMGHVHTSTHHQTTHQRYGQKRGFNSYKKVS